jgi:hypothetical protein
MIQQSHFSVCIPKDLKLGSGSNEHFYIHCVVHMSQHMEATAMPLLEEWINNMGKTIQWSSILYEDD